MFKNIALAAVLTLGVATTALASTSTLVEFDNFAVKTPIPASVVSSNIDWENLGSNDTAKRFYSDASTKQLIEWTGFASRTETPAMVASSVIDWSNIAGFIAKS